MTPDSAALMALLGIAAWTLLRPMLPVIGYVLLLIWEGGKRL